MDAKLLRVMVVVATCGLAACTTQEANPTPGTAGTSGGAGTSGAGSTGTGGGGGLPGNLGTNCLPPDQMLNAFTFDPDGGSMTDGRYGNFGVTLSGGTSTYPPAMVSDITGNDWHISGMVTDYSGFGIYFDDVNMCNKVDASAYAGIRFTIWGTTTGIVTMGIGTVGNAPKASWLLSVNAMGVTGMEPGTCMPTSGTQYYHPGCADATNAFTVTGTQAAPQTVSIMFTGSTGAVFAGGTPQANVVASDITSIYWFVNWMPGMAAYPIDLHIDNLAFIPK